MGINRGTTWLLTSKVNLGIALNAYEWALIRYINLISVSPRYGTRVAGIPKQIGRP